jgi:predicted transcriptional regulator
MDDQFTEDVKRLREQKMSERKIAEELKVSRSKVHDTLQKIQQAETIAALLSEDKMRSIIREELKLAHYSEEEDKEKVNGQFPVMRKMGGGMEVIAPEAVLRQYMGGTPEGELELRAIMKFRAAMLMVMDLVNIQKGSAEADAERMTPILRLMKETREEQDAAAHRAKESNVAIANQAAFETATQLSQVISQNNARITDSINQIRQAMGGKEENPLGQVLNSIQSMQQMMQMFGISMPGMPGLQGGVPPAQQWQPPPIIRRKRNESQGGEDVRSATTDDGNPPSP